MEKGKKKAPGLVATDRGNALSTKGKSARGPSISGAHLFLRFLRRDNDCTDYSSKFVCLA
jgi:hypothetical protein